jgi:hypothetical protein
MQKFEHSEILGAAKHTINVGKVNMEHQLDATITVFIDLEDQ